MAGIKYNTVSVAIDETKVYTAGRYYVGLGMSFQEFPLTQQNVEFSTAKTRDAPPLDVTLGAGGKVILDCSFQYTLNVGQLQAFYQKYLQNYADKFAKIGAAAIKGAARPLALTSFYNNRAGVQAACLQALKDAFAADYVTVHGFQLRAVSLPATTDNAILSALITQEQQRTTLNTQAMRSIEADTLIITADADARIRTLNANATAKATVLENVAQAVATATRLTAEGGASERIAATLGFTPDELLKFIWLSNLKVAKPDSEIVAGFNTPLIK